MGKLSHTGKRFGNAKNLHTGTWEHKSCGQNITGVKIVTQGKEKLVVVKIEPYYERRYEYKIMIKVIF